MSRKNQKELPEVPPNEPTTEIQNKSHKESEVIESACHFNESDIRTLLLRMNANLECIGEYMKDFSEGSHTAEPTMKDLIQAMSSNFYYLVKAIQELPEKFQEASGFQFDEAQTIHRDDYNRTKDALAGPSKWDKDK